MKLTEHNVLDAFFKSLRTDYPCDSCKGCPDTGEQCPTDVLRNLLIADIDPEELTHPCGLTNKDMEKPVEERSFCRSMYKFCADIIFEVNDETLGETGVLRVTKANPDKTSMHVGTYVSRDVANATLNRTTLYVLILNTKGILRAKNWI